MGIMLAALAEKKLPPEDWIIDGLLTRRNTGFIIGPSKEGCKSWLLLDASWNLSEGLPIWGTTNLKPGKPLRTVYFTQEDTEKNIQDRVLAHINAGKQAVATNVYLVPKNLNNKLDTPEGIVRIKRELDEAMKQMGKIDLVMFDPMRRMHDGNENDSQFIAQLWKPLEGMHNDYDCATLIAHHITKPPREREGYNPGDPYNGRGSGDIYGGGDAFVVIEPKELSPDGKSYRLLKAHFQSKRGEQMPPAKLKVNFFTGIVDYLGVCT
jgi:RecA-family ATPase